MERETLLPLLPKKERIVRKAILFLSCLHVMMSMGSSNFLSKGEARDYRF